MKVTLRELLGSILIVALALGWRLGHSRQERLVKQGALWRHATGFLEHVLQTRGFDVQWELNDKIVRVTNDKYYHASDVTFFEPKLDE